MGILNEQQLDEIQSEINSAFIGQKAQVVLNLEGQQQTREQKMSWEWEKPLRRIQPFLCAKGNTSLVYLEFRKAKKTSTNKQKEGSTNEKQGKEQKEKGKEIQDQNEPQNEKQPNEEMDANEKKDQIYYQSVLQPKVKRCQQWYNEYLATKKQRK